jgi:hypothetical protein
VSFPLVGSPQRLAEARILLKKDSGQARMTAKEENDFGEKGMKK